LNVDDTPVERQLRAIRSAETRKKFEAEIPSEEVPTQGCGAEILGS
jgi:hypothetical protein